MTGRPPGRSWLTAHRTRLRSRGSPLTEKSNLFVAQTGVTGAGQVFYKPTTLVGPGGRRRSARTITRMEETSALV
jgi:hypothetical protein